MSAIMIRKISLIFFTLFIATQVFATAQSPDEITVEAETFYLNTNPLTPYLKKIEWEIPKEAAIWSSNWRGYIAEWEIRNNSLYLSDVTIEVMDKSDALERSRKSILVDIFTKKEEVVAEWYSGALIIPDGSQVDYVHMGYGSTYEKYQIFRIHKGEVVDHKHLSLDEFRKYKDTKFSDFRKTDLFKKEYTDLTEGEYDWSEEEAVNFMRSFYAEYYLAQ